MRGKADFLSVHIKGRCCGLAYLVTYGDLTYLFYLAVDPRINGRGIGTKVLREILQRYKGKRLFLALEPLDPKAENYEMRVRRHTFYEYCGLVDLPCMLSEAEVSYAVMGSGEKILPEEYLELMDFHMGKLMRKLLHMRMIPVR